MIICPLTLNTDSSKICIEFYIDLGIAVGEVSGEVLVSELSGLMVVPPKGWPVKKERVEPSRNNIKKVITQN